MEEGVDVSCHRGGDELQARTSSIKSRRSPPSLAAKQLRRGMDPMHSGMLVVGVARDVLVLDIINWVMIDFWLCFGAAWWYLVFSPFLRSCHVHYILNHVGFLQQRVIF